MNDTQVFCNKLLKDLISIPSYDEEQFPRMQKYIADVLRDIGCEAHIDNTSGCIIGRKRVNPGAKTLLLSAHYDTVVPTAAWTIDPLKPVKKNGI